MQAPEWFRDSRGPGGSKPPPPTMVRSRPPTPGSQQTRSAVPGLPSVPAAPSTALALQPQGQLPPLPALAVLPPPPTAGGGTTTLAIAGPAAVAGPGAKARVNAAPAKQDQGAFIIPGLQVRPYTEEELSVAFEIIDLDRHTEISDTDIRRVLSLCGEKEATESEVAEMIRLMDPDGSGTVSYKEFRQYFMDPPPLFRNFDLHKRGGGEMVDMSDQNDADAPPAGSNKKEVELGDFGMALLGGEAPSQAPSKTPNKKRFMSKALSKSKDGGSDARRPWIQYLAPQGLSPEFIKKVYHDFVETDTQDTGYMTFQSFCRVFGKARGTKSQACFDAFDAEHEGELDLRQFVVGLSMFTVGTSVEDKVRFAFMMYDEDQEGSLGRDETSELLRSMMPFQRGDHREAHISRLYAMQNLHPNARIQFDELMEYINENPGALVPLPPDEEEGSD